MPYPYSEFPRHVVDALGIKTSYVTAGEPDGRPLLLLHGMTSSGDMYRELMHELADELWLIAPDIPGFGYSDSTTPGACPQEAMTLQDLAETGIEADTDHLMLVGEQPDWTREKRFRQYHVAKTHRVIMLIGDDLGDFLPCVRAKPVGPCTAATTQDRERVTLQHREYWGVGWYILPNPMHGSWTRFISSDFPKE